MFERFTERARQVVVLAQDEARALQHNYIGTEHLLLGLLREEEGIAARVLEARRVAADDVRRKVRAIVGEGDELPAGQVPFTPRAKKALELGLDEAVSMGHDYIGTEHLLLGVTRERDGLAARILRELGVDGEAIRGDVVALLGGRPRPTTRRRRLVPRELLLGWLLFAVALGIGLLLGWLIWG